MKKICRKILLSLGSVIIFLHLFRFINPRRKKIVMIDKSDCLGDIIIWLPYAELFRKKYPAEQYILKVLAFHHNKELLHYLKCIDEIVVIPAYKGRISWLFTRIFFWLKNPIDILICTNCTPNEFLVPYQSKSVNALVHSQIPAANPTCNKYVIQTDGMSRYEVYQHVLKSVGIYETPGTFDYSQIVCSAENKLTNTDYIVICPGARTADRQWEPEKFIRLIGLMLQKYSFKVVLVGNSKEKKLCQQIKNKTLHSESIIDLSGETTVSQLFTIINDAEFLISNETGTAHIGGVLGVKTFIISGGGDYGDFVPYPSDKEGKTVFSIFREDHHCFGCMWRNEYCIKNNRTAPCVSAITVQEIMDQIFKNIAR